MSLSCRPQMRGSGIHESWTTLLDAMTRVPTDVMVKIRLSAATEKK